jgi:exodeoxyribonuclease VII large subunit
LTSVVEVAALTVAEYASRVGRALRQVGPAVVEGEVQRPTVSRRGLMYFDLNDGDARLSCKVWPQDLRRLEHRPRAGDLVRVWVERPDLFAGAGKLDLVVSQVRLAGEGELLRRRAELLDRLGAEGLCEPGRRKPLPAFPRAVGVIAGRGSDGMADVVQALRERFPPVHVVTCCAVVQGLRAPADLVDALARLEAHPLVDVAIVARGGGSVQDLVAFDDERLCRAMVACRLPVVTAIGHTENVPVCSHVTWAAPTPSRAPELVVPAAGELWGGLERGAGALGAVPRRIGDRTERTGALVREVHVRTRVEAGTLAVDERARAIKVAQAAFLGERARALAHARGVLDGVPRRVPAAPALTALAQVLQARARAFFDERERGLAASTTGLSGAAGALRRREERLAEHEARVGAGIRRELADHERDYGRALSRHAREAGLALARALEGRHHDVSRGGAEVWVGARRRLAEVERDLRHASQLVEARDLRPRGWLLASDEAGRPVTGVEALRVGARLRLHLRDGAARVAVEHVEEHEEAG